MLLFWVIMATFWVGTLALIPYLVPAERRSLPIWVAAGGLLVASGNLLVQIASQRHWTLGVIGVLLPVAGVFCTATGTYSVWRRRRRRSSA